MSSVKQTGLAALLVMAAAGWAAADTVVEVSGQVRFRSELHHKSFDVNDDVWYGTNLRTRVGVTAVKDSNAHAFVQFQDSRVMGDRDQFGNWQSGTLSDGEGVDIHQAYVEIDRIWVDGLGTRTGRFELELGNQRVFGAVDWDIVGRSWEGSQIWYRSGPRRFTGFWLVKRAESDDNDHSWGGSIFGLHFRCDRANLELFGFYERDRDTTSLAHATNDDMDRYNYALYWKGQRDRFDLELNGVYQTGQKGDDFDISAFLFTTEAGVSFGADGKHRLAAGIDYASGDDNRYDSTDNTYDNLYYTGHKFRGYMDYFVATETAGLVDMMLRGKLGLDPQWTARCDFHYFQTAKDYVDPLYSAPIETTAIGMEFDFTLTTTSVVGVMVNAGASVFLPDESFVRFKLHDHSGSSKNDPTYWSYLQAAVDF
jgi:hypothetical protein